MMYDYVVENNKKLEMSTLSLRFIFFSFCLKKVNEK